MKIQNICSHYNNNISKWWGWTRKSICKLLVIVIIVFKRYPVHVHIV